MSAARVLSASLALSLFISGATAHCELNRTLNAVRSPGFPGNYSRSLNCSTTVIGPPGTLVQLIFLHFETEANTDFVYLHDGPDLSAPRLARLSGLEQQGQVFRTVQSNALTIRFTSDLDNDFSGFWARFDFVKENETVLLDCAALNQTLSERAAVLVSPLWPDKYPNQERCTYRPRPAWHRTRALRLRFNFFETEDSTDLLQVFRTVDFPDGKPLKSFSGNIEPGVEVTFCERRLVLLFRSDLDRNFRGFSVTYTALEECPPVTQPTTTPQRTTSTTPDTSPASSTTLTFSTSPTSSTSVISSTSTDVSTSPSTTPSPD